MNKLNFIKLLTLSTLISIQYINAQQTRKEHDLLGDKEVPADAYYGVQTMRAIENFLKNKEKKAKISCIPTFLQCFVQYCSVE